MSVTFMTGLLALTIKCLAVVYLLFELLLFLKKTAGNIYSGIRLSLLCSAKSTKSKMAAEMQLNYYFHEPRRGDLF